MQLSSNYLCIIFFLLPSLFPPLVPEKPKLMVSATDSGTALLQWYPPPNPPTPLLGYRLTFGRIDVLPFTVVEFPSKENRYTAQDIHKGANYVFRLSARNKMGYGEEAVKEVTTPEDAPSGYPENIISEEASATSLQLAWKSVPLIEQNGKITKYSVLYKDINSRGNASEVVIPVPGSSVLLEGLSADTVYDVRVSAFTAVGPGPYSPSVQFRTQRLDQGRTHTKFLTTHLHCSGCKTRSLTAQLRIYCPTCTCTLRHTTSDDNILRVLFRCLVTVVLDPTSFSKIKVRVLGVGQVSLSSRTHCVFKEQVDSLSLVLDNDVQVRSLCLVQWREIKGDLVNRVHVFSLFLSFSPFLYLSLCHQLQSKSSHEELCSAVLGDPRQEPSPALHCEYTCTLPSECGKI